MQVKICGITHLEDALLAEALGADFLGFVFEPSSARAIDYAKAKAIIAHLTKAKAVGVFVNQNHDEIDAIARDLNLAAVQLYEDYIFLKTPYQVIRALRIQGQKDFEKLPSLLNLYDYVLLDTYHPEQLGGSGQCFDWSLLPKDLQRCFLSGGIKPDNVRLALSYQPFAIDLASGVERQPGKKDQQKLMQLFKEIFDGR